MKFAVVSDLHCHLWSLFSTTTRSGINSRLQEILSQVEKAADHVKLEGGSTLVVAGDIFHTRGTIDPEVLNPVRDCFQRIVNNGVNVLIVPGNHDLKTKNTTALSSSVENLQNIEYMDFDGTSAVKVFNEPTIHETDCVPAVKFAFVPWCENTSELIAHIDALTVKLGKDVKDTYLFIHAGIDGVIPGLPAHGLSDALLAGYGFKAVFAGHYHNHKMMPGNIVSIGSPTHQTWGDVGTRAGYLIVDSETGEIVFNDTSAPKFVDVSGMSEEDAEMEAGGNYVRFRGPHMTQTEIDTMRKQFYAWGARGVSIQVPTSAPTARSSVTTPGKIVTLDESVTNFIAAKSMPASIDVTEVQKRAADVLNSVRTVTEEAA